MKEIIVPGMVVQLNSGRLLGKFKIMAIADGYAMIRRPRMVPCVISVKDLLNGLNDWPHGDRCGCTNCT